MFSAGSADEAIESRTSNVFSWIVCKCYELGKFKKVLCTVPDCVELLNIRMYSLIPIQVADVYGARKTRATHIASNNSS